MVLSMPKTAAFTIERHGLLGPLGEAKAGLPDFAQSSDRMRDLYRWMVLTRSFDAKAVSLQRTGRLGTFASSLGQEAVAVAVGFTIIFRYGLFRSPQAIIAITIIMNKILLATIEPHFQFWLDRQDCYPQLAGH